MEYFSQIDEGEGGNSTSVAAVKARPSFVALVFHRHSFCGSVHSCG